MTKEKILKKIQELVNQMATPRVLVGKPYGIQSSFPCKKCDVIDIVGFPEHNCTGNVPDEK